MAQPRNTPKQVAAAARRSHASRSARTSRSSCSAKAAMWSAWRSMWCLMRRRILRRASWAQTHPLAQAILGQPAGATVPYAVADEVEVHILSVAPSESTPRAPDSPRLVKPRLGGGEQGRRGGDGASGADGRCQVGQLQPGGARIGVGQTAMSTPQSWSRGRRSLEAAAAGYAR